MIKFANVNVLILIFGGYKPKKKSNVPIVAVYYPPYSCCFLPVRPNEFFISDFNIFTFVFRCDVVLDMLFND